MLSQSDPCFCGCIIATAGGPKKTPDIVAILHGLLEHDTAGDPITGLRWSRRTTTTIAAELAKLGISVSANTVARLLHQMGCSLRVNQKQISTSAHPDRNLQFEYLAELRHRFQRHHLPIVSVASKKRELAGNFRNPGRRWECEPPASTITISGRTPSVSPFLTAFMMFAKIASLLLGAFPTTHPPSPHMPWLTGGDRGARSAIPTHASCSSSPIRAAATAVVATPRKPKCSTSWPTRSP